MQFSNINYNLYKSFIVVYETSNISKAAELLYISQPAVSHNIKELEKQLGIQLFYKKANGVSATNEADILYKYISSAFNSILKGEQSILDMLGLKTGVVKTGIPSYLSVIYLSKIITEFRQAYPNIKIEIVSKPIPDLINMLQTQNIDIVVDSQPISTDKSKLEIKYLKSL
jgi:DNA-binding transcriptional LysR family regulator